MSFRDKQDAFFHSKEKLLEDKMSVALKDTMVPDKTNNDQAKFDKENQVETQIFSTEVNNISYFLLMMNLLPNVATSVMYQGVGLIEYHFTGKLQDNNISDGVNLGQNYIYLLQYYMSSGFIEGMAFLCAKSFGCKNLYLLGVQTNQTRLISLTFFAIMTIITVFFASPILNFMSQSEAITLIAKRYIIYMIPASFFLLNYEIYCKYAETQLIYRPKIYALILALIIHPILCYVFIIKLEYGEIGQAICSCISELCKMSVMVFYFTMKNPYPESNFFFNKDTFSGFCKLFNITLCNAVLYYFENAGGSIVGVFASNLKEVEYAKYVNLSNIALISFSIGYGFLTTGNIMVGNYIGANTPKNVKNTIIYMTVIAVCTGIVWLLLLIIFPSYFTFFFSQSEDVYKSPDMNWFVFLMGISEAFDIIQSSLQGCLLGLGIFKSTTFLGFISYFVLLPGLAYFFIFILDLGVAGLWYSPIIVYGGLTLLFGLMLTFADFEDLCKNYHENMKKHEIIKRSLILDLVKNSSSKIGIENEEKSISRKEVFI
jgi:MATE family multidrug resistance protein